MAHMESWLAWLLEEPEGSEGGGVDEVAELPFSTPEQPVAGKLHSAPLLPFSAMHA